MRQEIAFLGLFVPTLFVAALVAGVAWFVLDGLALRLGIWRVFWHPPLARLALYVVLFAFAAVLAPDF